MKSAYNPKVSSVEERLFRYYDEVADMIARQIVAVVLYHLHLIGWREIRIKRTYEAILSLLDMPPVMGKEAQASDAMDFISDQYGIDFDRLTVQKESLKQYRKKGRSNKCNG